MCADLGSGTSAIKFSTDAEYQELKGQLKRAHADINCANAKVTADEAVFNAHLGIGAPAPPRLPLEESKPANTSSSRFQQLIVHPVAAASAMLTSPQASYADGQGKTGQKATSGSKAPGAEQDDFADCLDCLDNALSKLLEQNNTLRVCGADLPVRPCPRLSNADIAQDLHCPDMILSNVVQLGLRLDPPLWLWIGTPTLRLTSAVHLRHWTLPIVSPSSQLGHADPAVWLSMSGLARPDVWRQVVDIIYSVLRQCPSTTLVRRRAKPDRAFHTLAAARVAPMPGNVLNQAAAYFRLIKELSHDNVRTGRR